MIKLYKFTIIKHLSVILIISLFVVVAFTQAQDSSSMLPKTCGEYVDYSQLYKYSVPGKEPPPLKGLPIIKTNGDKYFPAQKIESIWGKNILFTQYGDKQLSAKLAQSVTKQEEELKKLLKELPVPKGFTPPSQFPSTDKSALTAIPSPGAVDWVSCLVAFSASDISDSVTLSYIQFDSPQNALKSINITENQKKEAQQKGVVINKVENSKKIGDGYLYMESIVLAEGTRKSIDHFAVAAVKGKYQAGVLFFNKSDLGKADETLRMILGNLTGEVEEEKRPQEDQCVTAQPIITSFTPQQVQAGIEEFTPDLEMVDRKPIIYEVTIQGQCLQGAELSNNATFDPATGEHSDEMPILQIITKVSADSTSAQGQLGVHPDTQAGQVTFTLKNKWGKTATFSIQVKITGTQYLERAFPNQGITFVGSWPEVNERVFSLEIAIKRGLDVIRVGGYPKLGITQRIYEENYWKTGGGAQKACPGFSFNVSGCASPEDAENKISENVSHNIEVARTIAHESAHKLHFFNLGAYKPLPSSSTQFDASWRDLMKNVNTSTCSALPITPSPARWKNKSSDSRCGFTQPYGANGFSLKVFDDIATYVEDREFFPKAFNSGDSASGPFASIYNSKLKLLQEYGF